MLVTARHLVGTLIWNSFRHPPAVWILIRAVSNSQLSVKCVCRVIHASAVLTLSRLRNSIPSVVMAVCPQPLPMLPRDIPMLRLWHSYSLQLSSQFFHNQHATCHQPTMIMSVPYKLETQNSNLSLLQCNWCLSMEREIPTLICYSVTISSELRIQAQTCTPFLI